MLDEHRDRLDEFEARRVLADPNQDAQGRAAAARRLRRAGAYVLPDLLAAVKQDRSATVRAAAVHAAAGIAFDEKLAWPLELAEALTDGDEEVRLAASAYAGALDVPRESVPVLLEAIGHQDGTVRSAAADAIGRAGVKSEAVLEALEEATSDADWRVRWNAANSLWHLTRKADLAVPTQLAVAGDWELKNVEDIRWGLAELVADRAAESEAVLAQVTAALTGPVKKARSGAGMVMAAILLGDKPGLKDTKPRVRDALRRLAENGDEETRKRAARLLELRETPSGKRDDR